MKLSLLAGVVLLQIAALQATAAQPRPAGSSYQQDALVQDAGGKGSALTESAFKESATKDKATREKASSANPTVSKPTEDRLPEQEGMPHASASTNPYDDVPVDAVLRFLSVYEKVKQDYVEPVDDNEMFDHALRGLLSGLDPYSEYMDAKSYQALLDFTDGEVAQTGMEVRTSDVPSDAAWQIERVPEGSPAARAGLKVGMLLHKIDGKSTRSLSQHDIEQLLRGSVGTTVQLSVSEPGKHSVSVRVLRATPEDNAVKTTALSNGILVLKVSAFQGQTAAQIQEAISNYQKTSQLQAVLLDLRDNPGGLLSAAVEIADLFLDNGMIVSTRGRGEPEQRYQALSPAAYPTVRVAVLLNHYSASAAEVLAGALQDHKRGIIMGETSYGKGSVQKIWPLPDGHAIKLTVARYYTPSDRLIEGKGIQPDIKIDDVAISAGVDSTLEYALQALQLYSQLPK